MTQPSREVRVAVVTVPKSAGGKWIRSLQSLLFILPTMLFIGYFLYYPALTALGAAFSIWDGFNPPRFVGLQNFGRALDDTVLREAALNNIIWAIFKVIIFLVPPFIAAELIFFVRGKRMQYLYRTLFVFPLIVPTIVKILLWSYFYRGDGLLNQIGGFFGLGPVPWLTSPDIALYSLILMDFPWIAAFNLLIFYAGLQGISPEVLEAAALDGATGLRQVWSIHLPLVTPQTRLLLILAIINSVQAILEPLLMTGGGPGYATYMPLLYLFNVATQYGEFGYSSAIAMLLFGIVLLLTIINNRLLRGSGEGNTQ